MKSYEERQEADTALKTTAICRKKLWLAYRVRLFELQLKNVEKMENACYLSILEPFQ